MTTSASSESWGPEPRILLRPRVVFRYPRNVRRAGEAQAEGNQGRRADGAPRECRLGASRDRRGLPTSNSLALHDAAPPIEAGILEAGRAEPTRASRMMSTLWSEGAAGPPEIPSGGKWPRGVRQNPGDGGVRARGPRAERCGDPVVPRGWPEIAEMAPSASADCIAARAAWRRHIETRPCSGPGINCRVVR